MCCLYTSMAYNCKNLLEFKQDVVMKKQQSKSGTESYRLKERQVKEGPDKGTKKQFDQSYAAQSLRLYLEEVLDTLRVVAVALSTDSLHLFDLTRLAGGLDVFKVNFRLLTEVHNRAQEVEQA